MSLENEITKRITKFDPVSLEQINEVRLMHRNDTKFVFNIHYLPQLLEKAVDNYYMLEIEDKREHAYKTTYFDTKDYRMYQMHHNGKLNRHKIRIREYIDTQQEFLEVKRKNNRGETIKNRIELNTDDPEVEYEQSKNFVREYSPYNSDLLIPTLGNKFIRVTLINKNFSERITLDYKLKFTDLKYKLKTGTEGICIAEIKKSRNTAASLFLDYLKELKIHPMGFSKYCIGLAMLNPEVKNNLFKQKLRSLVKI